MLRDYEFDIEYRSGHQDQLDNFYTPALNRSIKSWRAAGYFSSSVFESLGEPLMDFVRRGGTMKLVCSVHLSEQDKQAIEEGTKEAQSVAIANMEEVVQKEFTAPLSSGVQILISLLKAKRLEIRIAIGKDGGLYHEKLGFFEDENGDFVAFSGSDNYTAPALVDNIETTDVFTSWGEGKDRAERKRDYLVSLFNEPRVGNAILFDLPDALEKIILKAHDETTDISETSSADNVKPDPRYRHQEEAVDWFMDPERANGTGILWMATGTGKTIAALNIANELFLNNQIDALVICATERLLNQWNDVMCGSHPGNRNRPISPWRTSSFWHTATNKSIGVFRQSSLAGKCLFTTYNFLPDILDEYKTFGKDLSRTLLIVDEVHNLGTEKRIENLSRHEEDSVGTKCTAFQFRLGLSATPFNEYDQVRNQFLIKAICTNRLEIVEAAAPIENTNTVDLEAIRTTLTETGSVFHFGLKDAICSGLLSPFEYIPFDYEPTDNEKEKLAGVRNMMFAKVAAGEARPTDAYILMAQVIKGFVSKIGVFESYLNSIPPSDRKSLLNRAIIFVNTMEYGKAVAESVHKFVGRYRTFFNKDDPSNLKLFSEGKLDLLITCHMISEGIDIRDLSSIILFSADRSQRETIQRMGRALRRNPKDPEKVANVVDFVYIDVDNSSEWIPADLHRKTWLTELSEARADA
jgi:superfamily II DNA or RNA helicase